MVKQPDLVMALFVRGDAFTPEQKARNFAYYEALTVRDSSLSACIQSIMAAEVGQLELAYDYLGEAALIDLDDLEHNTRDGLHIASLAGSWLALVAGLGGMRNNGEPVNGPGTGLLSFAPHLPAAITRLSFRLVYLGRRSGSWLPPPRPPISPSAGDACSSSTTAHRSPCGPGQPETRPIPPWSPGQPPPNRAGAGCPARRGGRADGQLG